MKEYPLFEQNPLTKAATLWRKQDSCGANKIIDAVFLSKSDSDKRCSFVGSSGMFEFSA
jgi:hypothetical protein